MSAVVEGSSRVIYALYPQNIFPELEDVQKELGQVPEKASLLTKISHYLPLEGVLSGTAANVKVPFSSSLFSKTVGWGLAASSIAAFGGESVGGGVPFLGMEPTTHLTMRVFILAFLKASAVPPKKPREVLLVPEEGQGASQAFSEKVNELQRHAQRVQRQEPSLSGTPQQVCALIKKGWYKEAYDSLYAYYLRSDKERKGSYVLMLAELMERMGTSLRIRKKQKEEYLYYLNLTKELLLDEIKDIHSHPAFVLFYLDLSKKSQVAEELFSLQCAANPSLLQTISGLELKNL